MKVKSVIHIVRMSFPKINSELREIILQLWVICF